MSTFLLKSIDFYQKAFAYRLSPCRFYPSCSNYATEAITDHGTLRGGLLTISRLLRCRPFGPSGYDPVPESCINHDCTHTTKVNHQNV
jgi:putative membrane protein insertion efficiency factor